MIIEATDQLTAIAGVPLRLWHGTTEGGTAVKVFVHLLAARADADCSQLERELQELPAPREVALLNVLFP